MVVDSVNPLTIVKSLISKRSLILALAKRDVVGRYRGSFMGLLWSFFYPLLMLAVYTFVFSVVFGARWQGGTGSRTEFALVLFTGLIAFNFFSECLGRAPTMIVSNVNYVKKVVFPLEILAVVNIVSAGFHMAVSAFVWLIFYLVLFGVPTPEILWLPVALLPLGFFTLGATWLLASLGVFLRDVSQVIMVVITVLMFMSPIFYSVEAMPEKYRPFILANPLTIIIEQVRGVMIWGRPINWSVWAWLVPVSILVAWIGFAWFQKTRKGFADVL
ncbi:ABC transporter permease [Xanthomonas campestris]|uniref:ABC transporter permease n=1 Tax=Xanthomonas campestris TaxID=339 RepID=UPI000E0F4269|nr:ABC transporter permease [Xanthomonas campestris]MEB2233093.1 ABC transporter permease [Xanthomonas campestris pv. campestris]